MIETRENYSMQDLINLMGQNAETVNGLANTVGDLQKDVRLMSVKMNSVEDSVTVIKQEITDIKENEEINFSQQQNIRSAVNTRVYSLLNIPRRRDDRTMSDRVNIQKYVSLFCRRCYTETQRKGHLGDPYRTTPKKNYDMAMHDIEAWYPSNGVDGLRKEADENALARKIAEEQGYIN
ncbi:MAG: hypothetical protein LUE87_06335 [Lachnospiraceae bacterium]|nr:hypothetical protein [Lachnospiraceae bacterium]